MAAFLQTPPDDCFLSEQTFDFLISENGDLPLSVSGRLPGR